MAFIEFLSNSKCTFYTHFNFHNACLHTRYENVKAFVTKGRVGEIEKTGKLFPFQLL